MSESSEELMRYLRVQKEADAIRSKYGGSSTKVEAMQLLYEEMAKKKQQITNIGLDNCTETKKNTEVPKPPKSKNISSKPKLPVYPQPNSVA